MSSQVDRSPRLSDRSNILIAARNEKMARSQHAYVRGSTTKFYEWLEAGPISNAVKGLRSGFAGIATSAISGPSPTPRAVWTFKSAIWTKPSSAIRRTTSFVWAFL